MCRSHNDLEWEGTAELKHPKLWPHECLSKWATSLDCVGKETMQGSFLCFLTLNKLTKKAIFFSRTC